MKKLSLPLLADTVITRRKGLKMTQAELGTAVGLGENAQNRIAHYERGTRVPQKELLDRMAEVLDVNRQAYFCTVAKE